MALLSSSLPGRAVWRALLACALAAAPLPIARPAEAPAAPAVSAENGVKAGFLPKFPQFVEWPAKSFPNAQSPIVIGVLGEDPFGSYLDEVVQGEKIGERAIVVRRFQRLDEAAECHILFFSRSEAAQFEKLLPALAGRNILTVGDTDGFERAGGMVIFAIENGKIALRINRRAAEAAQLTISSKLLRQATIVTREKG